MKRLRLILAGAASAALFALALAGAPSDKEKAKAPEAFMLQKRLHSQMVLDGLMQGDFDAIVISGEGMKKMTRDTRWRRFETDDYYRYSEAFQNHAQAMVDSARAKNLDGAMEGYLKSIQTCYNCHKYVRADRLSK